MYAFRQQATPQRRRLICLDLVQSATRVEGEPLPGLDSRVRACRRLLLHARARGWDVTHVYPRSAAKASRPAEGLEPLPTERLVYRTGLSAFSSRPFCEAIEAMPEAELILVSFSLSSACLVTALTAHDWGLPVTVISDAMLGGGGEAEQSARAAITPFARLAGADDLIDVRHGLRLVVDHCAA